MSADTVINLIALIVAIITLVILSVRLGMQIKPNDSNHAKKDRQSHK